MGELHRRRQRRFRPCDHLLAGATVGRIVRAEWHRDSALMAVLARTAPALRRTDPGDEPRPRGQFDVPRRSLKKFRKDPRISEGAWQHSRAIDDSGDSQYSAPGTKMVLKRLRNGTIIGVSSHAREFVDQERTRQAGEAAPPPRRDEPSIGAG